jgi:hypothetical protein
MKEFGVRRYGDSIYRHCLADSAAAAANWFAHSQSGLEERDFQALVKDMSLPEKGFGERGDNPVTIHVRRGPHTESGQNVTDLKRTSDLVR